MPPTAEEQARRAAEAQVRQQAEEKARVEKQTAVKATAQSIWNRAKPAAINHPYLAAKGITAAGAIDGLRQNPYKGDLNLLVPVMYEREVVNYSPSTKRAANASWPAARSKAVMRWWVMRAKPKTAL